MPALPRHPHRLPHPPSAPVGAGLVPALAPLINGAPGKARLGACPAPLQDPVNISSHLRHNLPARLFPPQIRDAPPTALHPKPGVYPSMALRLQPQSIPDRRQSKPRSSSLHSTLSTLFESSVDLPHFETGILRSVKRQRLPKRQDFCGTM